MQTVSINILLTQVLKTDLLEIRNEIKCHLQQVSVSGSHSIVYYKKKMFCVKQFRVWITQKVVEPSFHIAFRTIYSGKLSRETTSQRPQTQFTLKFMGDFVPYFCGSRCQLWVNLILSVAKLRPHTLLIISFTCCFPSAIHHLFTVAVSDKLISKCLKKKIYHKKGIYFNKKQTWTWKAR